MLKTQAVGLISALLLLGFVLNLVRRRRLREEYSWLWLLSASFYLVMSLFPKLVTVLADFLGITSPITALLFSGLFFIVLILIHYSVKLSRQADRIKDVAQQIAILEGEQYRLDQALNQLNQMHSNENMLLIQEQYQASLEQTDIMLNETSELAPGSE